MEFESFFDLLVKGGYTILILAICSILALKVILEKFIVFKSLNEKFIKDYTYKINQAIGKGNFEKAEEDLDRNFRWLNFQLKSPLQEVFRFVILNREKDKEELLEGSYIKSDIEIVRLEKGLNILATLGSITPFIGLFGTVIGIIKAFEALSVQASFAYSNVMAGIAEALISTAAGLLVAIPSVMFYNHFTKKIKNIMPYFEDSINTTVSNVVKQGSSKRYEKI